MLYWAAAARGVGGWGRGKKGLGEEWKEAASGVDSTCSIGIILFRSRCTPAEAATKPPSAKQASVLLC